MRYSLQSRKGFTHTKMHNFGLLKSICLILPFCLLFAGGCKQDTAKKAETKPLTVQTLVAQSDSQPYWVDVFGQTEGEKAVLIYPQITGPILEKVYSEGDFVNKGDTLYIIDPAPFKAAFKAAEAAVEQAKATLDQAQREAKRYTELWKSKAVSNKEYSDAVSAMHIAKATYAAALAKKKEAEITLGYTEVKAPVSGIAGRSLVNPGTLVQANQTNLTDITQDQSLKVRFSASDNDLHGYKLTKETPVEVSNSNLENSVHGKIDFSATQIDTTTGTRALSAILDPSELLPGQFVSVRLFLGDQDNVFLVPQKAVRQLSDGGYSVFVLEDGKARTRKIEVGRWKGKDWIVTGGLKDGDIVIINQVQRLRDRMPVNVAQPQS